MEAIRFTVHVRPDGTLEWPDPFPELPAGEAEVILLLPARSEQHPPTGEHSATVASDQILARNWPRLKAGAWKGKTLRREELYGEAGR